MSGENKIRRIANNKNYDCEFLPSDQRRFWKKVDKSDGCWNWIRAISATGYGDFGLNGKTVKAHRLMYHKYVEYVPEEMVIDHICRNTACVRPDHLRIITQKENTMIGFSPYAINARKTHCKRGHEFSPENTELRGKPNVNYGRHCIKCQAYKRRLRSAEKRKIDALLSGDKGE